MFASLKNMSRAEFWGLLGFGVTLGPTWCAAGLILMAVTGQGTGKGVVVCSIGTVLLVFQVLILRMMIHGT